MALARACHGGHGCFDGVRPLQPCFCSRPWLLLLAMAAIVGLAAAAGLDAPVALDTVCAEGHEAWPQCQRLCPQGAGSLRATAGYTGLFLPEYNISLAVGVHDTTQPDLAIRLLIQSADGNRTFESYSWPSFCALTKGASCPLTGGAEVKAALPSLEVPPPFCGGGARGSGGSASRSR